MFPSGGESLGKAKKLAAAGALVIGAKVAAVCGAGAVVSNWLDELFDSGRMVSACLNLELGMRESPSPSPGLPLILNPEDSQESGTSPEPTEVPAETAEPTTGGEQYTDEGTLIVPTTIYGGLTIKNSTSYDIDVGALLAEGTGITLPSEGPQVLIVHTHGSEAYTPDAYDRYEETDTDRTEDKNYNVIRVGDELSEALEAQGISVLHDREIYDYPSYTGSYSRSGAAVESYLAQYPDIAVVIDLHRDALGDGEVTYKTVAELDGVASSQLMMLVGTGESGLYHPNWTENLKLALYLQQAVNARYPTLARPVSVVQERYNQHLSTGSFILEVGSNGNSLQEAITAVRLFADAVGPALKELESG